MQGVGRILVPRGIVCRMCSETKHFTVGLSDRWNLYKYYNRWQATLHQLIYLTGFNRKVLAAIPSMFLHFSGVVGLPQIYQNQLFIEYLAIHETPNTLLFLKPIQAFRMLLKEPDHCLLSSKSG